MNFLNFEYVLTIRRVGTIRGAAEELLISPQSLSENLGKLERELGAPIFHRTKPLTLTPVGERFVICAETCMEAKRTLELELAAITRKNDTNISLGVPTGMPPPLLLAFITYFRSLRPELTVTLSELPSKTGAFHEIPGHIDAVFGEFQGDVGKIQYTPILQSRRFVVAIHKKLLKACLVTEADTVIARVASHEEPLKLWDFRECPFVLKRTGSVVRDNEDRLFRDARFVPKSYIETGDMDLTIRLVLQGEAAVFFPEPVAKACFLYPQMVPQEDSDILLCPIAAEQELWQLAVGWNRYRRVPEGISALVSAAQTFYENMLGD